jgi:Zn-dependent peptidase ImmA (M78 family)/DNA-binding XRE family transcriptional regulator
MTERATAVNPDILRWARERAGYSADDVAAKLGVRVDTIFSWEDHSASPTFRQLEQLAEVVYKRPIALFFFPEAPAEPVPSTQFRTLPASELDDLAPDTLYALREALGFQASLRELTNNHNPAERLILRDVRGRLDVPIPNLASAVRGVLGISLQEQWSWDSVEDAFKRWRRALESAGVFVFKRAFKQEGISGFCLHDETFPVLMINNSTAQARQVFTLFHELAHLLFSTGGITKDDGRYLSSLTDTNRRIEIACNQLATEILVPESTFPWADVPQMGWETSVGLLADRYRVSREVILLRLVDRGLVDQRTYEASARRWNQEFRLARAGRAGGGGNYYATQAAYLGERYLRMTFAQYNAGRLSLSELAGHLGIKAKNVPRLEDFLVSVGPA